MPAAAFQGPLNRDFTAKSEVYCEYSAAVGQNSSFQQHPMQPALSLRQHLFSNRFDALGLYLLPAMAEAMRFVQDQFRPEKE